jgi:hypothetical protein
MTGGLLELGPGLTRPLLAALACGAPALQSVPAAGSGLDGARLLALEPGTPHEPAIRRAVAAALGSSGRIAAGAC